MQFAKAWHKVTDTSEQRIGLSLIGLVLAAVLPLLIFGGGAAWMVVDQKKNAVEAELVSTARALQAAVDQELFGQLELMELLSTDVSLDSGDLVAFQGRALRAIQNHNDWRNVSLIDPKTHLLVASALPIPKLAPTTAWPTEVDEVVKTRKAVIAGVLAVGKIVKVPAIHFLAPVIRDGEVRYVMVVVMNTDELAEVLKAQQLPATWTGAVLDQHRVIAGRSREPQLYLGKLATPTLTDRMAASEHGMFTALNQEGSPVYTVFSRSSLTGWSAPIGIPAAEVEGPIKLILLQWAAAGSVLILLALLLTGWVGRGILRARNAYEAALKESEAFKNIILNSVGEEIAVLDHEGVIRVVNEPWRRFALENSSIPGMPDPSMEVGVNYLAVCLRSVDQAEQAGAANEGIRAVLTGALPSFNLEYTCHSSDQQRWFRMSVLPLGLGTNVGVVVTHTNITEQVLSEQKQAAALSRLQKIASRVPGVVFQFRLRPDGSSCVPYASEAVRDIYRVSPQEIHDNAAPIFAAVHQDDLAKHLASIQASAKNLSLWHHEYRLKFEDGPERWLLGNATPEREADGSVLWHGFITDITEQKLAEQALRNLSIAVEQSPASIVITDRYANIEYVNPQFTQNSGYSLAEVIGQNPRIVQSRLTPRATYLQLWEHLLAGQAWHGELVNQRKNGDRYWEECHISPVKNNSGSVTHYVAIKTDVTQRIQTAEKMDALLLEQKTILNNDLVGIATVRERKIVWANPAFEKMLGYAPGELEGATTQANFLGEAAYQTFGDKAYSALAAGKSYRNRDEYVRTDGEHIWLDVSGAKLNQSSGESLWCFIDVTQQVLAERLLMQSEANIKSVLDNAADAMFMTDQSGHYQYVNDAASRILGYSRAQLLQMSIVDLTPGEDLPGVLLKFKQLVSSGSMRTELRLLRKNGLVIPVDFNGTMLPDGSALGSCRDITERKQMEEQVRQLAFYDSLTGLANRRLLNDRLVHAMVESKRTGRHGALMFLDLDNFKPLNDAHGHEAGDLLLIEVAVRLKACVREMDSVARFGGDEFIVLLTQLTPERDASIAEAAVVAEKIRSALARPYVLELSSEGASPAITAEHHCSASIGVTIFIGQDASAEDVLRWADKAMYEAKAHGRNQVCFSDSDAHPSQTRA